MEQTTKKCPYCGEEILAVAIKCKHCGEWLNRNQEDTAPEEDRDIIRKKLLLIKELEVVTGVSLKDAKEAVDATGDLEAAKAYLREKGLIEKSTKKCPYCGEEILIEAKKCKHCGEWLDKSVNPQSPITVINNVTTPETQDYGAQLLEEPEDKVGCLLFIEGLIITGALAYIYDWSLWVSYLAFAVICAFMEMSQIVRVIVSIVFSVLWGLIASAFFPWGGVGIIAFFIAIACHWNSMMKKIF